MARLAMASAAGLVSGVSEGAAAALPSDLVAGLKGRGHALLIAVSAYQDAGWGRLPETAVEVDNLAQGLMGHFATVQTLKDPDTAHLRGALRQFLTGKWNNDSERLFVFYAGHGFTDFNQNSGSYNGYITGIDTPAYQPDSTDAVSAALAFQEIDALNRETRARHVMMIFDSCFAGSLFLTRSAPADPVDYDIGRLRSLNDAPSRFFITSGDATNEIPADSPMATLVLRGLQGEADFFKSGYVTDEELAIYLKRNIPRYSRRPLNPQSGGIADARLNAGRFIFLTDLQRSEPPVATEAPLAPSQIPPAGAVRSYLVFFDWGKSNLTDRARDIIAMAARAYQSVAPARIGIAGYTDTSFSPEDAIRLSLQEARAVAAQLVKDGVPQAAISVVAFGSSYPLVPTAVGVREPQNRRVEITLSH
jgi:outer membrane protein OmpA-like peptidoglycan-associated protein